MVSFHWLWFSHAFAGQLLISIVYICCFVLVPLQDNDFDCALYTCRFLYVIFNIKDEAITYYDVQGEVPPLRTKVVDHPLMKEIPSVMTQFRLQLKKLIENLHIVSSSSVISNIEKVENCDGLTDVADSKVPSVEIPLVSNPSTSMSEIQTVDLSGLEKKDKITFVHELKGTSIEAVRKDSPARRKDSINDYEDSIQELRSPRKKDVEVDESGRVATVESGKIDNETSVKKNEKPIIQQITGKRWFFNDVISHKPSDLFGESTDEESKDETPSKNQELRSPRKKDVEVDESGRVATVESGKIDNETSVKKNEKPIIQQITGKRWFFNDVISHKPSDLFGESTDEESKDESTDEASVQLQRSPNKDGKRRILSDSEYEADFNEESTSTVIASPRKKPGVSAYIDMEKAPTCICCKQIVLSFIPCAKCLQHMHVGCSVSVSDDRNFPLSVCTNCSAGYKRYRSGIIDKKSMRSQRKLVDYAAKIDRRRAEDKESPDNRFIRILTHLTEIRTKRRMFRGNMIRKFEGRSQFLEIIEIPEETLYEKFLYFFNEDKVRIQRKCENNDENWMKLSEDCRKYIQGYGRCFRHDEIYKALLECEKADIQWSYMKFHFCREGVNDATGLSYVLVDYLWEDRKQQMKKRGDFGWISLTNDKSRAEIPIVPLHFMETWKYSFSVDDNSRSEFEKMFAKATRKVGRWVEVDAGSSRLRVSDPLQNQDNEVSQCRNIPLYRPQPKGENSCVMNSLLNAMHYINDYRARDELLKMLPMSLSPDEYEVHANSRKAFTAYVMNFCVKGYESRSLLKFDVLNNRSIWPTLCVLKGSDGGINHAVTVVENYIFDGNCQHALPLTIQSLNWCCSSDEIRDVEFVEVYSAYRFAKRKPSPNLLIRGFDKVNKAMKCIIKVMKQIGDSLAVEKLDELLLNLTPEHDILNKVRETLNRKPLGYRAVSIDSIDILLKESINLSPMMIILHMKGTFHYTIICVADGYIYIDDGTNTPIILSEDNLSRLFQRSTDNVIPECKDIEVIKGYVFLKSSSGFASTDFNRKRMKTNDMK
jgi:hypothetical protein